MKGYWYVEIQDRGIIGLFSTVYGVLAGGVGAFSPLIHVEDYQALWYVPIRVGSLVLFVFGLWLWWCIFKSVREDANS